VAFAAAKCRDLTTSAVHHASRKETQLKKITQTIGLALCLAAISGSALAAPKTGKTTPPAMYECTKCHMKFSAATAKKDHYKDPMDGGALVPVKSAPAGKGGSHTKPTMGSMGM
jgi:hypothetical protein